MGSGSFWLFLRRNPVSKKVWKKCCNIQDTSMFYFIINILLRKKLNRDTSEKSGSGTGTKKENTSR